MNYLDRSHYFRGLLLLIGKDGHIAEKERELLLRIGKTLDFESSFCQETIDNLLRNKYVDYEPPIFSDIELARTFIREGVRVSVIDNLLHVFEYEWLQSIAVTNNLESWFAREFNNLLQLNKDKFDTVTEIEKYFSRKVA